MQAFEALRQKPIVARAVGGVQAVVADHRDSRILEQRERTEVTHQCKFRHERENLFDVMVFAGFVDAEGGYAGFKTELVDAFERFVIFDAPVKIHDDFVDVEPLQCVDLLWTANENGNVHPLCHCSMCMTYRLNHAKMRAFCCGICLTVILDLIGNLLAGTACDFRDMVQKFSAVFC